MRNIGQLSYLPALLTATALSSCPGLAQAQAQAQAQEGNEAASLGIQEIIVTAQKRAESLQDVPISIGVLTQDGLAANRISSLTDIGATLPNVRITDGVGRGLTPNIDMRGIHTTALTPAQDSEIPIYLDGVPLPGSQGISFDLPALERIEVMRGPQGTLFGRNSTGGAISVLTRDPPGEFGVRLTSTVGNYRQLRLAAVVDTPEYHGFSGTVSYAHNERRGDIRNLGAGQRWDRSASPISGQGVAFSPKYLGDKNIESIFVAVKFQPSDSFRAVYKFDRVENHFTIPGYGAVSFTPENSGTTGERLAALYAANPFPIAGAKRPKAVNSGFTTPSFQQAGGHNLTITVEPTDSVTVKNILSTRYLTVDANNVGFGLGGLYGQTGVLGTTGQPFEIFAAQTRTHARQWSEELQVNYESDLLTLTTGAMYVKVKSDFGGPFGLAASLFLASVPGGVLPRVADTTAFANNKSLAGYAQAEVHVTPQLDLIAGARITNDKKHSVSNLANGGQFISDYDDTRLSYNAGLNYTFRQGLMVYAKYATSFLSGGSLNTIEFDPETVKSWEAGMKGEFLDNRLRINLAVWDAKYRGLQTSIRGALVNRPDVPSALVSLGDLNARGFEVDITARPTTALTLGGGLGYTDYKLFNLNPRVGTDSNYRLQYRPAWTANGYAQYETASGLGDANLVIRSDASWRDKFRAAPFVPVPANNRSVEFVDPELILNARMALENISLGSSSLEIAAWVKNITDSGSLTAPVALSATADPTAYLFQVSGYTEARTFGIDLKLQF